MSFEIIDISRDLVTSEVYPGDITPELSVFSSISDGDMCNMAMLKTTLHCGTHTDAPLHFFNGGNSVNRLPLDNFIGECKVIEVREGRITGEYVDKYFPKGAVRVLMKSSGKAYFDKTGAEEISYLGIKLIGTDSLSVGGAEDEAGPHRALLGEGVSILENLDLSKVSPGNYFLFAPPVKIAGAEASPVRAVLISGYVFWSN